MTTATSTPTRHAYELEFIGRIEGRLHPEPQLVGPTPEGLRIIFPLAGGTLEGPRVRGTVQPVGADFYLLRTDGVAQIDVRTAVKTHDGALLYVTYTGVADMGEKGYENALQGKVPNPIRLRVALRIQTAHPSYAWLNRLQLIGIGESVPGSNLVAYDLYAIK
jgi:hypothetical protein